MSDFEETARRIPVVRAFVALGPGRTAAIVAGVSFVLALGYAAVTTWPGASPGISWVADTQYYYGAGERLNAGHEL